MSGSDAGAEGDSNSEEASIKEDKQDSRMAAKPILWYGGLDRSGTPDLNAHSGAHDPYVVAIAAVAFPNGDIASLREEFAKLRERFGMPIHKEFHATRLTEEVILAVLEMAHAFQLTTGAVLIDKARTVIEWEPGIAYPSADQLREEATAFLADRFFQSCRFAKLWCDEDVRGLAAAEERTMLQRRHGAIWLNAKMQRQHKASRHSEIIQIADLVAYSLRQHAIGSIREQWLGNLVKTMRESPGNVMIGPFAWPRGGFQVEAR